MNTRQRTLHEGMVCPGIYQDEDPAGAPPVTTPPAPVTPATVPEPTEAERLKAEAQRDIDRYRNEAGQAAKKAREMEAELKKLKDASLSETERLKAAADQVPALEQERTTWQQRAEAAEAEISADVEARKKVLPAELAGLMPQGTPAVQLAWIRQAEAAALKLKPANGALPPAGGRNPGTGNSKTEPSEEERQRHAASMASRF